MDKQYIALIGQPFKNLVKKMDMPELDSSAFDVQSLATIRRHMSGVSTKDSKLVKQLLSTINQGIIEELNQEHQQLHIKVIIQQKSEQYLIHFTLFITMWKWQFQSIQYLGTRAGHFKKRGFVIGVVSLILLTLATIYYQPALTWLTHTFGQEDRDEDEDHLHLNESQDGQEQFENQEILEKDQVSTSNDQDSLSLERVKEWATAHQWMLLSEKEYKELTVSNERDDQDKTPEQLNDKPIQDITIHVLPGMNSQEVAQLLVDHELARSVKEVEELFVVLDMQKRIKTGKYTFQSDATYVEIMNRLQAGE